MLKIVQMYYKYKHIIYLQILNLLKNLNIFFCFVIYALFAKNSYSQEIGKVFLNANKYYEQNNYSLAQKTYLSALKLAENEKNYIIMAKSSRSVGLCHYYLRDKKNALKWLYKSIDISKKHNLDSIIPQTHYFISVMYIEIAQEDSAIKYSDLAIKTWSLDKNFVSLSKVYSALSDLHLNLTKNKQKADSLISNAEKYAYLSGNQSSIAFAEMKRFFYFYLLVKDYKKALPHINKAEYYYKQTKNNEDISYAISFKASCLAKLGDTSAAQYFWKWFKFKDSVFQIEKSANVAKYETIYETEKKDEENKLLQKENELNRLILLIVVIVFLLILSLGLWLNIRNNFNKKQNELLLLKKIQKDRERIARDLHDNIGGQLSYIIYSLENINNETKTKRIDIANSITISARSVINNLRETIWAINDSNINLQDFSDKLKVYTRTLFKHSKIQISFTENIIFNRELNSLLSLNLFRICQEILNNSLKYSNASEVKIEIKDENDERAITITDNGIGFEIKNTNKEQYGLQNIRKRADEFGIKVTLETEINKGTKYFLIV